MELAAVILAAGKGTRMKSKLPKVLHTVCGSAMLSCVVDAAAGAGVQKMVVVAGFGADQVAREVDGRAEVVLQAEQLGTAHALAQAGPLLKDFSGCLLVLCGDTPLIEAGTLAELVEKHRSMGAAATVLTAEMENPAGYGRVIRDEQGRVLKIVEQKDASADEILVREVNTGVYCFEGAGLFDTLARITPANAQGEYYLTDIIDIYAKNGRTVGAVVLKNHMEMTGINDRVQLAEVEQYMRRRVLNELMRAGVTVIDPLSTFVSRKARVGRDTVIHPFTIIEGETVIGEDCVIGPGSRLVDAAVGNGVSIQNSIVLDSDIGDNCNIGPYAYLRPETTLGRTVKVGDFVEIKKSVIGDGSKVPHLSYVGDAVVGKKVNVGAGTITCNYDGRQKWTTRIGDGAFIGSNTNLVAPVEVGGQAVTGAGSTITKDVAPGALGVERAKQIVIKNWADRKKIKD
ncbi:bifunctional UDP-N-acetylglucosamine diphosphorylase/glucosamine-1-phosphate N-acetyltransferase GlmU [Pelotomaculum terephthalicicum JT]|uniref:bifunctional UDP-N-acetylglucosamine diphosphorylase/glucosamine-1-phosphate N-acetyltransferase GlmU n=1 Tax=Pelotomaculum TaxID=191373 RepID=UPI0009CEB39E|nr:MULTISPECIES: bifunctional UDP-N-acetylglucosamine diphosphorylase/glucosamine-1-phosphate N-acetyltransferase GlmU [Pelotomaculum]MCG9969018.1 bifunctional UDP-N-acetylglucosamine diphosphorylase/glucosamine-1-phosphate N-acetyltransferase GlmU [Pelotomaculum terephthalicicum JT]OPX91378.1 MAG: Bifunctional protein GlmU [Pelotomaculum sp. PtaB.Bin117]OPY59373.1 MAG: Bifunctional protein GlmU [Pelotomaculum sp. PtaU1.Bin065]